MPFLLAALAALFFVTDCLGQVYQPGFRTVGLRNEDPPLRVDISLWYPTLRRPRDIQYQPWTITGALNAKPADGRFPVLVISHATPADRFAYHDLAALLAREGFIVAAPTHGTDWMNNMDSLFTWNQLTDRVREINAAIEMILTAKDFAGCADPNRIGLIGFGSGATVALLMGGALPSAASWPDYCRSAPKNDVYCRPWAQNRINEICSVFPLKASMANPKIKAVAAIAPGFGMLFNSKSFEYFYPPLLLVCAARTQFNRSRLHCEPLAKLLGAKARFMVLPDADENALMAPCPPALIEELPELCYSVSEAERGAIHTRLSEALLAFFGHYLAITGNLPIIPDPPALGSPLQPQDTASKRAKN